MKELSLDEISLLEEMKSNCLKKGQYIDDKAKDKFNMLCHLEDFGIAYYELLDVIKEAIEYIENMPYLQEVDEEFEDVDGEVYFTYKEWDDTELLDILKGVDKE